MRPVGLRTKIFIDSGDPGETRAAIAALGFLDGQTTNPTLISRHPRARDRLERGEKLSKEELFGFYREVVEEISGLIPEGSISVEVYADSSTSSAEMLAMGEEMFSWIPNAQVKFPTTREGLTAARGALDLWMRVNMTLCFSQDQAAAVYAATKGAKRGDVYLSPFVGRLDDRGENGMAVVANIRTMYRSGDGHVELLTASVRKLDHLLYALQLGSDIITAPLKVLLQWTDEGFQIPADDYKYDATGLRAIPYKDLPLTRDWTNYDLRHDLTDRGMESFSADWNLMVKG